MSAAIIQVTPDNTACPFNPASFAGLPTGATEFTVTPPTAGGSINVSSHGMLPGNADNTAAFNAAIAAAKAAGPTRLVIPTGVYYFDGRLLLQDVNDLEISGQGSEFIFRSIAGYFWLFNVNRVWIHDLKVDWGGTTPLAHYGVMTAKSGSTVTLNFPKVSSVPASIRMDPMEAVSPVDYAPLARGNERFSDTPTGRSNLNANTLQMTSAWLATYPVNTAFRFRQFLYQRHAFDMTSARHVKYERVDIYGVPGMGYVVYRDSHHVEWQASSIKPRPASGNIVSSTADGIHINNSQGFLKAENCQFVLMGDDGMNIKDNTAQGMDILSSTSIRLHQAEDWRFRLEVGHVLEFRNPDYTPAGFSPPIASVSRSGAVVTLTFSGTLPSGLTTNCFAFNDSYNTRNYIVRNNTFGPNRARGLLLKAPNGLVEGNTFYGQMAAAIQLHVGIWTAGADPEGTIIDNVIIRNNTFKEVDRYSAGRGVITSNMDNMLVAPAYDAIRNVLIQGNTFDDFRDWAVRLRFSNNIIFGGNTFRTGTVMTGGSSTPRWGTVDVFDSNNIKQCCNQWIGSFPAANQGFYYDDSNSNAPTGCPPSSGSPTRSPTITATRTYPGSPTRTPTVTITPTPVSAGSVISLNFRGGSAANGTPALMGAGENAGPYPVDTWNNLIGGSGLVTGLLSNSGGATAASVSWTAVAPWSTSLADSAGNPRLMKGYVESNGVITSTVQVTGIPASMASGGYRVYVLYDGDSGTAARTGNYSIGGTTIEGIDDDLFDGTWVQGGSGSPGNYIVFNGLTSTSFTLTFRGGPSTDAYSRAPVNGIQIVANSMVTPSATSSATRSSTPSPASTFSASPTRTPSVSPSRTSTASPTVALSRTATPSPSATASPTLAITATHTRSATSTASPSASRTATSSVTLSPLVSATPTNTPSPLHSATASPTQTAVVSATQTLSGTSSATPSRTETPVDTATLSATATLTNTVVPSNTASPSETATPIVTVAPSNTATPSHSSTPINTATPPNTVIPTVTATPSFTAVSTVTWTATSTRTLTPSATPTHTLGIVAGATATSTPTPTHSPVATAPGNSAGKGKPKIIEGVASPNPVMGRTTANISYNLEFGVDQVKWMLYSRAMVVLTKGEWMPALRSGWHQGAMDVSGLASGSYFVKLVAQNGQGEVSEPYMLKLVVLR